MKKQLPEIIGLPPVAELDTKVKTSLVIMMWKCPLNFQTLVVLVVVRSFAMY